MGKRKLGTTTFWQCDWTGYPMKAAHCYWPVWSANGKLQKKGSYCNWESVVADVQAHNLAESEHNRIMQHIDAICGATPDAAPHYQNLAHTKGMMTEVAFHKECTRTDKPITGVVIAHTGEVEEITLAPDSLGRLDENVFRQHFGSDDLQCFYSTRKKTVKGSDKELCVWFHNNPDKVNPNSTATNLFKMSLFGNVVIVQVSREACFRPRERYISYTKAEYEEYFTKRRKKVEPHSLSGVQYDKLKKEMQHDLNKYESRAAEQALPPQQMTTQTSVRKTDGRSLAASVKARAATVGSGAMVAPPSLLDRWQD